MAEKRTKKTVITNVRVFDGSSLSALQTVVIDGDLIGNNANGADETVDGEGGVLLPGLIDSHVHLQHQDHLRELARHGVTSALDMATWPPEKINRLRGTSGLTDIRSAGLPVTAAGSMHSHVLPLPNEAMLSGPEQAQGFVEKRIAEGSDYIKVIADIPGPNQETLDAVVAASHENAKMVVAHAASFDSFQMALKADADVVTHAPLDKPADDAMINNMSANKTISVPTLIMMKELCQGPPLSTMLGVFFRPSMLATVIKGKRSKRGAQSYENAKASVERMHRAGVPVLAGSDCHEEAGTYVEVKHGYSLHQELELLVDAGLSTVDALRAATVLPAQFFNLPDRGVIEPGKRADLVLLRENPVEHICATRSISRVWCGGLDVDLSPVATV